LLPTVMHVVEAPHAVWVVPYCPPEHVTYELLPTHSVCPGAQLPPHVAVKPDCMQVELPAQATADPHVPFAVQVSTPFTPVVGSHLSWPGAHTPVQPSVVEHAWFVVVQLTGDPREPVAEHSDASLPEHEYVPGWHATQTPWLFSTMQKASAPVQVTSGTVKLPVASQPSTVLPLHVDWPGAQLPAQAVPTHVLFVHGVVSTGVPLAPHVVGELVAASQPSWPGAHVPMQAPPEALFTQVWFTHGIGAPY